MSFRGTSGQGMMTTAMAIDPTKHAGLERVGDFPFAVFASTDVVPRARDIAERGARALRFLGSALDVEPELALLVLAPDDWEGRASHPVYGMPNYDGAGNLVVAGAPSDFWRGFVGLVAETQPDALSMLTEAYKVDGEIDLSPFFDLLAIHEMGHRLHQVGVVRFPRLRTTTAGISVASTRLPSACTTPVARWYSGVSGTGSASPTRNSSLPSTR